MTEKSPVIKLKNLTKVSKNRVESLALTNANLKMKKGKSVAIVGPADSGKSTLIHLIDLPDLS